MKKFAGFILGMLLSMPVFAQGVPWAVLVYQRDVTGIEVNLFDVTPTPGTNCAIQLDASSYQPSCIPVAPAVSQSAATRALNTGYQISTTRNSMVFYSVQITVTASIASGQDGEVVLEIASNSGFTTNVQSLAIAPCSQLYTLAIALQGVQKCALSVSGFVPAGYYTRLRTVSTTGSPVFTYRTGQEVLL